MKKSKLFEIFGWYGMVAILTAFVLISFNYVKSNSFLYQILNLTGALGIALNAFNKKDAPAMVLNVVYALIAGVVLLIILI